MSFRFPTRTARRAERIAREAARAKYRKEMTIERAVSKLEGAIQIAGDYELAALLAHPDAAKLALALFQRALAVRGLNTDAQWIGFDEAAAQLGVPAYIEQMIKIGDRQNDEAFDRSLSEEG